jgi:hypothetical protein
MRKLILVFAAIAITAGVYAQAGSTNKTTSSQNVDKTQNQNLQNNQQDLKSTQNQNPQNNQQDMNMTQGQNNSDVQSSCSGVVMINGKMMNMNNGTMSPFDDNGTSMINGTKIMSDGTYTQKNGSKMKMKEGYHMDMAGNIMVPLKTTYNKNGTQKGDLSSTDKSSTDKTKANKSSTQNVQKSSGDKSSSDKTNNAKSGNQNVQNNSNDKSKSDGIVMENGKMMKVKNGQRTILQDNEMTMSNGTKIMSDGTCITKDGTKLTMKEGQHMDMEGNMVNTKTNKDNNMDYNRHDSNNPVDKSNLDGVVMQNGKMMKVKNGQKTALQDNEMTMSNGTKIMSDGTCVTKDGTKLTMKEGQHMDMSGNMVTTKTNKDKDMYLIQDSTRNREN